MLLNVIKEIQQGDIIGVLTLGGMEAICKVEAVSRDTLLVSDYRLIMITPKGEMTLRSSPLCAKKGEPVNLQRNTLAMTFIPDEEIVHEYKEIVSGIVLPKTGGIIT